MGQMLCLISGAILHTSVVSSRFETDVPMSYSALLIPDPYDCLGEDKSQVKGSRREFTTINSIDTGIILGDDLLTHNPCKLPIHTRKLANYTGVIVCSVKAYRRLTDAASPQNCSLSQRLRLVKGLRRGFEVLFYDPTLVEPFTNGDEIFSHGPEDATKDFAQQTHPVAHVMELVESKHRIAHTHKCQEYLLGACQDTSVVGVYSAFHDYAIYALRYTHPEIIRLTLLAGTLLDRFKSGRVLLEGVMTRDFAKYRKRPPAWKESKEDDDLHVNSTSNKLNLKRVHKLGQFVMDELCKPKTRKMFSKLLAGLSGAIGLVSATGPAAPVIVPTAVVVVLAKWVYDIYRQIPDILMRLMAYVVDLILVMQLLFLVLAGEKAKISRPLIMCVVEVYRDSIVKAEVHTKIKTYVTETGVLNRMGRDQAFNTVDGLLKRYCESPDIVQLKDHVLSARGPAAGQSDAR
ncbi:hypothetical protein FIBSPDRAFT_1039759 [Athelia psychrophila]|uniref:Uncharacterized protein n=1 Tax=Athelia psychrophila TaxID=1759441 RepID=A0A166RA42_9AGAM|nr:hypothetical protein FIBSPDRAFT_1039759 [Fibularhizoctonia sp. CBS 109695]